MKIGIFAKTFPRPSLEETLDAVAATGLAHVQFNLVCAGLPTLPETLDPALCDRIREAFAHRGLTMAAISGTFNMIHPDPVRRRIGLERLRVLAGGCRRMGTSLITLCTGTRDPENMWCWHHENTAPSAWTNLVESMRSALVIAEDADLTMAFEPEGANVIHSAELAQRLLEELGGPTHRLKVVMDPANLFPETDRDRMDQILDDAFERLGPHIALAHAKDLDHDGRTGNVPAGRGCLDYPRYVPWLGRVRYDGPLILHGLDEAEVGSSIAFLRRVIEVGD